MSNGRLPKTSPFSASFLALNGLLGALALVLSALETLLPAMPFLPPGAKLGLSNLATMYAAGCIGLFPALCIAVMKGLFAGLLRGITAMLMSLTGGICSTLIMWAVSRRDRFGMIGVGILGALAHNAAQLLVAWALTSAAVLWYTPVLILFSLLTGTVTGVLLRVVMPLLKKLS